MSDEQLNHGAVGLIIDRALHRQPAIGAACLIEADKVAVCASSVRDYAHDLVALKIRFPEFSLEAGVADLKLHPQYAPGAGDVIDKYNIAILTLTGTVGELPPQAAQHLNQRLGQGLLQTYTGDLSEFELSGVLQTLTNGRKSGTLVVADERGTERARVFMSGGVIRQAYFERLRGEHAVFQLYSQKAPGKFRFEPGEQPDWVDQQPLGIPGEAILGEAFRRLSELQGLRQYLGFDTLSVQATRPTPELNGVPPQVVQTTNIIWNYLDGHLPPNKLWRIADRDDYDIYMALCLLKQTGQIQLMPSQPPLLPSLPCFKLHYQALSPMTKVTAACIDPYSEKTFYETATVSGIIFPFDASHLTYAAQMRLYHGSPLLMKDALAGLHCALFNDSSGEQKSAMIGAASISEVLSGSGAQVQPALRAPVFMPDQGRTYLDAADQAYRGAQLDIAEQNYRKAVETAKKQPGDPFLSEALRKLATFLVEKFDLDEAEFLAQKAHGLDREFYGDSSLPVADDLCVLAECNRLKARYSSAAQFYKQALAIRERELGENDQRVGLLVARTILSQLQGDDQNDLLPLHQRAHSYYRNAKPEGDWLRYLQLDYIINDYVLAGQRVDAERICKREHEYMNLIFDQRDPDMVTINRKLAEILNAGSRPNITREQAVAAQQSMDSGPAEAAAAAGMDSSSSKTTMGGGMSRWSTKKKDEASLSDEECIAKATQLEVRGDHAEAERLFKEGIAQLDAKFGARHPKTRAAMSKYAAFLRRLKRHSEAVFIETKLKNESGAGSDSREILDQGIMRRFMDMF